MGYCNGVLYWMFDDCWPAALGWSLVDYYGLPKPAYYSFKRCAGKLIGSVSPSNGKYEIRLSADRDLNAEAKIRAFLLKNGRIAQQTETEAFVSAYGVTTAELPLAFDEKAVIVCDVECNGITDRCFYQCGTLNLIPCDVALTGKSENSVTLRADNYVHAVELEGEYIFEDNYFSMLPGQAKKIGFRKCGKNDDLSVKAYTIGG